jgi:hypothetical protein
MAAIRYDCVVGNSALDGKELAALKDDDWFKHVPKEAPSSAKAAAPAESAEKSATAAAVSVSAVDDASERKSAS